jgi:hypothetical protein
MAEAISLEARLGLPASVTGPVAVPVGAP